MACIVSKAASVPVICYPPGTQLDWTITIPESYDLGSVTVVVEVLNAGEVAWRYSSGVDSNVSISAQVVTLAIDPATESEDDLGNTFAVAMSTATGFVRYNVDFSQTGSDIVDYRLQGDFSVLAEHGIF